MAGKRIQMQGKVVFAAMSKSNFYLREHIIKYILLKGYTPMCAFMMYSYFLLDTVNRDSLIEATNDLLSRSDELWVFGEISSGVNEEIKLAKKLHKKISYFSIENAPQDFFLRSESETVTSQIQVVHTSHLP